MPVAGRHALHHALCLGGPQLCVHTMKLGRWGPPWWGLGPVPAPPGHRCDQTGLPVRPQGATFTGQPAGCSRYTAVTRNKPLDFERGRPFFNHGKLLLLCYLENYCFE